MFNFVSGALFGIVLTILAMWLLAIGVAWGKQIEEKNQKSN